MMKASWLKKLVLVAALAVMPLQGLVAAIATADCSADELAHAVHEGGHDRGAAHGGQQDDGALGGGGSHPCCQSSISTGPAVTLPAAIPDSPIRALAPDPLHDLFVPDQPERPPLA